MRRAAILAVLGVAVVAGAAYYFLAGRDYVFRFTSEQLTQALSERLPIDKTYFSIFQVTLDEPRITLLEGSDRIIAGLDVTLRIGIGNVALSFGGSAEGSGGIRYDPARGQFFLNDPIIEDIDMQGVPDEYLSRTAGALTAALADYYLDHPIYTLDPSDYRQSAAQLILKSVVVEDQVLVVTLGIVPDDDG